jgi:succinate dehydrogenase / fumarate reductase iron-sulfur subunit
MANGQTVTFAIRRFQPGAGASPHWRPYPVAVHAGMTVLQGLQQIRERIDPTLSWRSSCRMGVCGSCAMIVNGRPGLVCNTQILDIHGVEIRLEPLANFPVVKDLIADLTPMFEGHAAVRPYLVRRDEDLGESSGELSQTPDQLTDYLQFSYCIKCGACMAACPTVAIDDHFLGPMPLTAAHRYDADSRDEGFGQRKAQLAGFHAAAHCHYAGECSRVCPKGVDPARAIQLLKKDLVMDWLGLGRRVSASKVAPRSGDEPPVDRRGVPPFTVKRP